MFGKRGFALRLGIRSKWFRMPVLHQRAPKVPANSGCSPSVNVEGDSTSRAPGADDNASGVVTLLECLRDIVQAGVVLKRTLEFHWYAAHEIGLVGSSKIAESYAENNVTVVGMLNLDVVSYHEEGVDDIGIYLDDGNAQIIRFIQILTDEYLTYGWQNVNCGPGCSDHASWTNAGYPAVFASEIVLHPGIHTGNDTLPTMNFSQLHEFIKLAISYAVEFGEPSK